MWPIDVELLSIHPSEWNLEILFKKDIWKLNLNQKSKEAFLSFKQSGVLILFCCRNGTGVFPNKLRFSLKVLDHVVHIKICYIKLKEEQSPGQEPTVISR